MLCELPVMAEPPAGCRRNDEKLSTLGLSMLEVCNCTGAVTRPSAPIRAFTICRERAPFAPIQLEELVIAVTGDENDAVSLRHGTLNRNQGPDLGARVLDLIEIARRQ